ncbi:MAG: serine/threonine-protein kinase, partial [Gloeomargarita sp. DG02_3_bins_56]
MRRYRGAEITAVPDPSPPPAQAERRYRGVKITPPPARAPEQPQEGEMAAVSVPSQADVLKPPPPKPRNLLGGRYQIMYPLGVGGFCQTLLAMDRQRPGHPRCVVKQLRPSHKHAQHLAIARRLFCAEAETLEKLGQHPQIPRLL